MKLNYSYINSNNTKVNIYITTKENNINNPDEIIKAFKEQLEAGLILMYEDTYSGELYGCDDYIYNTTYSFSNLKFNCTFGEHDKILKIDIVFNINNTYKINTFNKERYYRAKTILEAI